MFKTCSLCKKAKNTLEFNKHKQRKDGLSSWCRECSKEKSKKYTQDPIRKAKKSEYDKKYRAKNIDKLKKYAKKYSDSHKEEKKIYDKLYRKVKGEERLKAKRDYYHSGGGKEVASAWAAANPDKVKANSVNNNKNRKSQKEKSPSIPSSDMVNWLQEQPKICSYCGKSCKDDYEVDHVQPLSKGGEHTLNNMAISCKRCNRSKSSSSMVVFLARKVQGE